MDERLGCCHRGSNVSTVVTQVAVKPGRFQFIGADNQLPAEYGREFTEIDFSYESPTVATVAHPGRHR